MAGEPCGAGKRGERPRVHVARGRNTARRRGARVRRARGARRVAGGRVRSSVSRGARSVRASVLRASSSARARQHVARRRALGARTHASLSQAESTRPAGRAARGELTAASGGFLCPLLLAVRRSEEHTSELQSQSNLVCRLLLEKKKQNIAHLMLVLA